MLDGFENSVCLFVKVANCKTLRTEYTACGIVCFLTTDSNWLWCLMNVLAAEISCEFWNWVVFPFPHTFLFFVIVSDPAPNQPTQSDCLDFVLCILFSYMFLPPYLKGLFYQNQCLICDAAEVDVFLLFFFFFFFLSSRCECNKIKTLWLI